MKVERFYLAFGDESFHPCSINRSTGRFHPHTTIGPPYAGDKRLEDLILPFGARRFHLRIVIGSP